MMRVGKGLAETSKWVVDTVWRRGASSIAISREDVAMSHELRIYNIVPGKMPDINKRFNDVTMGLFKKHNMRWMGHNFTFHLVA
jgi:hypothetical protein